MEDKHLNQSNTKLPGERGVVEEENVDVDRQRRQYLADVNNAGQIAQ